MHLDAHQEMVDYLMHVTKPHQMTVRDDVQHLKTLQHYTHMMPLPDNAPLPMFSNEQLKQMVFKAACQTIGMSTSFIFMAL